MGLFTWTASQLATNVSFADDEHKILFDKLNKLYDLSTGGAGRSAIGSQLDDLISYIVDHFAHEEKEMIAKNYADYDRHKAEHEALLDICGGLQKKLHAANADVTDDEDVRQIVKGWIDNFIPNYDKAYKDALRSTGTTDPGPSLKHP